ncbi:hypothetical protein EYF80_062424 [Liparis tanakae]|uniref:Uncharacterized protein n=1 Tax=Liparis tanakae TaxID=230148 RepID=A0A4Z2EFA4_9TELE|nr:hypothetical protein EYF80_062424 [Liparis tanakae]
MKNKENQYETVDSDQRASNHLQTDRQPERGRERRTDEPQGARGTFHIEHREVERRTGRGWKKVIFTSWSLKLRVVSSPWSGDPSVDRRDWSQLNAPVWIPTRSVCLEDRDTSASCPRLMKLSKLITTHPHSAR